MGTRALTWLMALALAAPAAMAPAAPRTLPALPGLQQLEHGGLRSIATWLRQSGKEGYLAGEVADAAGIPRAASELSLGVSQRGFRSGDVLRVAQFSADAQREFLLFMVQHADGAVFFYVSTPRDGLKKAFVSIPDQGAVMPLGADDARAAFEHEISYWEARTAGL